MVGNTHVNSNLIDVEYTELVSAGVKIIGSTASTASLNLPKGTYIVAVHMTATCANGYHQEAVTLSHGALVNKSSYVNLGIFSGADITWYYLVELSTTTTVTVTRPKVSNSSLDYTKYSDSIAIEAIKIK